MTGTKTDIRILRTAIAEAITAALDGHDFTATAEWVRPSACPCHADSSVSCLLTSGQCQGHVADRPLPGDKAITADELIAALPEPDSAGLVSATEAGNALGREVRTRLKDQPYRQAQAFQLLGEALDSLEQSMTAKAPAKDTGMPRCAWCGEPIPVERGPQARFCKNSHRVAAAKKKAREKVAAGAGRPLSRYPSGLLPGRRTARLSI